MKEKVILSAIPIFLTGFASAATSWNFSVRDLFDSIDSETLFLVCTFLLITLLVNLSLGRFKLFKKDSGDRNTTATGITAVIVALMITYYMYRSGFIIGSNLSSIGLDQEILSIIIPIIVIGGLIAMFWKLRLHTLWIIGLILILATLFTEIFYDKSLPFMIGLCLIGAWFLIKMFKKKGKSKEYQSTPELGEYNRNMRRLQDEINSLRDQLHRHPQNRELQNRISSLQHRMQQYRDMSRRLIDRVRQRQQQQAQQQEAIVQQRRAQTQRTQRELQEKYNSYRYSAQQICKQIGHIPSKRNNPREYWQWHRYVQAVKAIEKVARKNGFSLR